MKYSDQCLYAFNKASKVMGMIKKTIKHKEAGIMVSLFKTLVRPHVEYCVSAWSLYYKKDNELLEKVQRRFTKMIINMEGLSYELKIMLLEAMMQWALRDNDSGVRVDGQLVSNLRFADDIDLNRIRRPASRPYRQSE